MTKEKTGIINSFESFATLDGDGIRFEIFFAGCPLRCVCCHNPEMWEQKGQAYTSTQLLKMIKRYQPYFQQRGGVTWSGGEPLLQAEFLLELGQHLKQEHIHIALDTSGCITNDRVEKVLDLCDLVLLDLKQNTEEKYRQYAKGSLAQTIKFLNLCQQKKKKVWIRTVIIPHINDTLKDIRAFANLVKEYSCIEQYDLLPFHTMGFSKYETYHIPNPLQEEKDLSIEAMEPLKQELKTLLPNVKVE